VSETPSETWRPTANFNVLEMRADALARTREFFSSRWVLEVDTPMVVNAPVTDVHIHSAEVRFPSNDTGAPNPATPAPSVTDGLTVRRSSAYYLHTSPEFAMKRLLAAGSADIYQICHVVRGLERGRQHNAEFTLVEWYRLGYSLERLMDETEELARYVLGAAATSLRSERVTYAEAFKAVLGLDPLTAPLAVLREVAGKAGLATPSTPGGLGPVAPPPGAQASGEQAERDELLEFLMSAKVGPTLGRGALTCVHRYPASQAALARLDENDPRCALRFELYCEGMELANGFHELASAAEQRSRFEHDLAERRRRGLPADRMDELLLAALASGLPDCAGVALGFDRLLMIASGARHIDEVLPFPIERA
jgi:elongation factor P--(R)-beta-lysine ligase